MSIRQAFFKVIPFVMVFAFVVSCNTVAPDVVDMMDDMDMKGGTPAPTFTLNSVSGAEVSLTDFAGKPLVIFFFGNTCPLCIASAPTVQSKIAEGFTTNEIGIIGIDVWDGNASSVNNFRDRTGVTFDLLLNGSAVGSSYATTYDRLVVVDKDGNLVFKGGSAAGNNADDVVNVLKGLLE